MDNIFCKQLNIQYDFLNDASAMAEDEKKNPAACSFTLISRCSLKNQ